MNLTYKDKNQEIEFLKTKIYKIGLSSNLLKKLETQNVRTIRAILNRKKSSGFIGLNDAEISVLDDRIKDALLKYKESALKNISNKEKYAQLENSYFSDEVQKEMLTENKNILDTFADLLLIERGLLEDETRKKEIVAARHLVAYVLREYADMSFPAIGRLIGGRDHTTIIHAYNKIDKELKNNKKLKDQVEKLVSVANQIKVRKQEIKHALDIETSSISKVKNQTKRPIKITERDLKVLDLYREGLTLNDVGRIFNLSHERIRQIVVKTIRSKVINESINKGIKIDVNTAVEEEKKKHRNNLYPKKEKVEKIKRWSRYYLSCKECGTTKTAHYKHGLCQRCGGKSVSGKERELICEKHNNSCDKCGMLRHESFKEFGRDLYIANKNESLFCQACFWEFRGSTLGKHKNFEWSRFYPCCKKCSTVAVPHFKKGLCENCSPYLTDVQREKIIMNHSKKCDYCDISRANALLKYTRDLNVMEDKSVACRKCFLNRNRKKHQK